MLIAQHIMGCRYVMDVYMPRDRMNRAEHRGFGFVTFETEAAILRVASYGGHMIRYICCFWLTIPFALIEAAAHRQKLFALNSSLYASSTILSPQVQEFSSADWPMGSQLASFLF